MQSFLELYGDRSIEEVSFPTGIGDPGAYLHKVTYDIELPDLYDYTIYGIPPKG